jgi:DNA-directed RNA polymerase specialized sigma24 family protein
MKIKYTFVTGETADVEVPDEWGVIIQEIEHQSDLRERAETRRHQSIQALKDDSGVDLADDSINIDIFHDQLNIDHALSYIQPQQRELVKRVYFEGKTIASIAVEDGVSEAAIRNRLQKIHRQLEKFLS